MPIEAGPAPGGRPETATEQWRRELAEWRIPDEILTNAPESPWGFPVEFFRAPQAPADTPSTRRAREALPRDGAVLDVGCGGGAAGLALVPPAGELTGVDPSAELLGEFELAAARRGVRRQAVQGAWLDVADQAPVADVVVCHHVVYNVPDLAGFVAALTSHARHRVVLELTAAHPMVRLGPLWRRFHGLERPHGPTADLAERVISDMGIRVAREVWQRPASDVPRDKRVAFVRRRLCLGADRDPEIDAALGEDETRPPDAVTLWWDARD